MNKLLLISIVLVLFACKKDKTQADPLDIQGNFLSVIEESYNYTSENSYTSYNHVMELTVQNDSIRFDNRSFPLSSYDLIAGSGTHTISLPQNAHATLTISNNANTIQYEEIYPSYLSGPSWGTTISGTRTTAAATTPTNNTFNGLSGNYNLYIQAFENYNAIDMEYTGTFPVSYTSVPSELVVDGDSHSMPLFHTFYTSTSNNTQFNESIIHDVYWENDSLYYHYRRIGGLSWPPSDTAHYHYQGTKQ